jgi:hypothetical protein
VPSEGCSGRSFRLAEFARALGISRGALAAIVRSHALGDNAARFDGCQFLRHGSRWRVWPSSVWLRDGRLRDCVSVDTAASRLGIAPCTLRQHLRENRTRRPGRLMVSRWRTVQACKFSHEWRVWSDDDGSTP